jgi:membrane-associated phospholipid phosphatase
MRRLPWFILLAIVAIVVAHLGDRWAYAHLVSRDVYDHDLGRMLRTMGYYPFWVVAGLALWLESRNARRGLLLALTPGVAGLVDEVLKILSQRERPGLHDGAYVFRSFTGAWWKTSDVGLPSSHAMVAFSAAWILCRFYPRASAVWLTLAAGCAITRVEAQAHFLSDVTVAAVAGILVAEGIYRTVERRETRDGRRDTRDGRRETREERRSAPTPS